jgi:hypothetical protein
MRTIAFALALSVSIGLASCARSDVASRSPAGIFGSVTATPGCPVQRAEASCSPRPWIGSIRATDDAGASFVVRTDATGAYRLELAPGTYEVEPVTSGPLSSASPPSVVVVAGSMRRLDLRVDTGIR